MRCGDASAGRPISRTHDDAGHATDSTECSIRHERTQIVRHDGWWACGCGKPYGPEHLAEIAAIGKGANMDLNDDRCVCGHPQTDHLYGDYYDADDIKRKHQGECGQCGCQGYC